MQFGTIKAGGLSKRLNLQIDFLMIFPGFVDLQVNGFGGVDLNDPNNSVEDILEMSGMLFGRGTIGFLATLITNERSIIEKNIFQITQAIKKQKKNKNILGIHLEGPFISPKKGYRGVHPKNFISSSDYDWFIKLQNIAEGNIRIVTLAPETKNSLQFIQKVSSSVIVSVGHSSASYQTLASAVQAGLSLATHFGNGVKSSLDRHDNILFHILAFPEIALSIISDGFHIPDFFIKMIFNSVPIERIIAVSDSVKFAGMPPGPYTWMGSDLILEPGGRLYIKNQSQLQAGGTSSMLQCANHLANSIEISFPHLTQLVFYNPLRILKIKPNIFFEQKHTVVYNKVEAKFDLII